MTEITPWHYVVLSALVFCMGVVGVLARRNLFIVFMSVELMLNASNLAFVAFSRLHGDNVGQVVVLFVIAIAAAEISVGLAIAIALFRLRESVDLDVFRELKG